MQSSDSYSPDRHIGMMFNNSEACFSFHSSPNNWTTSSLCQLDCLSPGGSTMSFSLSSPPYHINHLELETPIVFSNKDDQLCVLNSTISPSIFSPKDKETRQPYLLKKRDYTVHREILSDETFFLDDKSTQVEQRSSVDKGVTLMATPSASNVLPIITPDSVYQGQQTKIHNKNRIKQVTPLTSKKFDGVRTTCNCKKSKCLKLYCDCFAGLQYCDSRLCNCLGCFNNIDNDVARKEAIQITKDRNSSAFMTQSERNSSSNGCHCKNSHCLKKYCECFNRSSFCGISCKCQSCQNFKDSSNLGKAREVHNKTAPLKQSSVAAAGVPAKKGRVEECVLLKQFLNTGLLLPINEVRGTVGRVTLGSKCDTMLTDKTKTSANPISYAFFGPQLPETSKIVALKCLDYLVGAEIYHMSQVSTLWAQVAVDDALWE